MITDPAKSAHNPDNPDLTAAMTFLGQVLDHDMPSGTPTSLAQRNLRRSLSVRVPSGQRVAKAMKVPVLTRADLHDAGDQGLDRRTPLWFYVLREADVVADGRHLGPVGGGSSAR